MPFSLQFNDSFVRRVCFQTKKDDAKKKLDEKKEADKKVPHIPGKIFQQNKNWCEKYFLEAKRSFSCVGKTNLGRRNLGETKFRRRNLGGEIWEAKFGDKIQVLETKFYVLETKFLVLETKFRFWRRNLGGDDFGVDFLSYVDFSVRRFWC